MSDYIKYKHCHQKYYRTHRDKISKRNNEYNSRVSKDPVYRMMKSSKYHAKMKNLEHSITKNDITVPTHCPLLGIELFYGHSYGAGHNQNAPSLDRIDSTKGYIPGNVWVISRKANTMKSNATKEELLLFSKNIIYLFE